VRRAASGGKLVGKRSILSKTAHTDHFQMMNMAKIVWAFDITTDATVDTNIETAYTNGFLTAPLKFPVKFAPRSLKHKEVIEREFESVRPFLEKFES
jgi:hypothetical protein